ncbi:MAG: potassium transporter [Methanocella sp. PtaU1.Bin125]|nr:MAG: potassium transporter [Methanocella sp. PtaU1.Bin125]
MDPLRDVKVIFNNLKGLFLIIGIIMLAMAALSWYAGDIQAFIGFFIGAAIGIGAGMILYLYLPGKKNPELKHAMVIAALAYLFISAISMIPYITAIHLSPVDAFFESISGWTGTGLTMIASPESASPMILLWRSVTQWAGGLGVIVLMVTILIRPGTSTYMLYQSEAHKDKLRPSIRSTLNTIWGLYVLLTAAGLLLLFVAGMPLWDALNASMSAIGTGGFSIYASSISAYDSMLIELALIPVMIAGAMPFIVLYKTFRKGIHSLIGDPQVRAFLMIITAGAGVLAIENYGHYQSVIATVRYSVFQFISALTGAGFQTADLAQWSRPALLIMTVAMVIGGCAGSTSSGLKIARIIFLSDQVKLWFAKVLRSKNAITVLKVNDRRVTEDIISAELTEATFMSFLWVVALLLSIFLISNLVGPEHDFTHVIFDVSSALGNAGMSCGIINPGLSFPGKIVIIIDMWIGRLEIIPVMLLARYLFKGFRF